MSARAEAAEKLIDKFLADVREFAEAVQVLASFEKDEADSKDTCSIFRGSGNFHARVGMAHQFMIEDDARTRDYILRKDNDEDEDEGGDKTIS